MQTKIETQKFGSLYLSTIESLSEEIARAISAIAHDDIDALERHLGRQQTLSAQLLALNLSGRHLRMEPTAWPPVSDALRRLQQNNRAFSTVLAVSGRSHRVMLALLNAYKHSHLPAEQDQNARTLSCEV